MTLEQLLDKQAELNHKKKILEFRVKYNPADYANEWLALANEYAEIDSKCNFTYCMAHYKHYAPATRVLTDDAPRYAWQDAANMGGG